MITSPELQGRWNEIKGKVKQKWGQMTDDDFTTAGGNVDQLIGRIQQKTGQARGEIEKFFSGFEHSDFLHTASDYASQAAETVRETANKATHMAKEGFQQAKHYSSEGMHQAEEMVRRYPGSALGLAFGVGLVLGMMCASSSRSHWLY